MLGAFWPEDRNRAYFQNDMHF